MTIGTEVNRVDYSGTTGTVFPYTFKIFADADMLVVKRQISTSLDTTLTLTTDYTVTGAGDDAGGTVVLASSLTTAYSLTLKRQLSILQETDYVDNDPFPAETHEEALDRLTMIAQQLNEENDRAIKLSVGSTYSNVTLPDPEDGYILGWSGATLTNVAGISGTVSVTAYSETLLATGTSAAARSVLGTKSDHEIEEYVSQMVHGF